ncbi:MAG: NAD(P)-dependent oxidoreductase [Cyanobacteriota bacterium]
MKILIYGANGGLGLQLHKILSQSSFTIIPYNFTDLDIRREEVVLNSLKNKDFNLIIFSKGYEDIYNAEENQQTAYDINTTGALNLAKICKEKDVPLIYLSTDYVFDGKKNTPYSPEDETNPLNTLGKSKLAGEKAIQEILDKYYIIRTSKLFGEMRTNFIDELIEKARTGQDFKAFNDVKYTPTWTFTLSKTIDKLISTTKLKINYGIYHCTNSGSCTDFDLIAEVLHSLKLYNKLFPVKYAETDYKPEIPLYSVLDCSKSPGIRIDWRDAFHNYLKNKGLIQEDI